jgi:putative ubiquitin-RnfH superfamily antitoxin RatB of RatAB toxin-antitoxin module
MKVCVAYAGPEGESIVDVELADGATLAEAVERSGLVRALSLAALPLAYAIHGQRADGATPLRSGDRIEILRPLLADPKEARRRHAAERPLARRPLPGKRRRPVAS